jgi:hypothetical protein
MLNGGVNMNKYKKVYNHSKKHIKKLYNLLQIKKKHSKTSFSLKHNVSYYSEYEGNEYDIYIYTNRIIIVGLDYTRDWVKNYRFFTFEEFVGIWKTEDHLHSPTYYIDEIVKTLTQQEKYDFDRLESGLI